MAKEAESFTLTAKSGLFFRYMAITVLAVSFIIGLTNFCTSFLNSRSNAAEYLNGADLIIFFVIVKYLPLFYSNNLKQLTIIK